MIGCVGALKLPSNVRLYVELPHASGTDVKKKKKTSQDPFACTGRGNCKNKKTTLNRQDPDCYLQRILGSNSLEMKVVITVDGRSRANATVNDQQQ